MFYQGRRSCGQSFSLVRQAFLQADGLPFRDVVSEDDIQQAFEAEHVHFARGEGDIYTPAITLWAFLSQALHAQRLRSCAAAVSRVIVFSLATAAVCGVAIGPYKGKGTGEPALLRELFDRFEPGDVFLGDCYFSSYFLLALFRARQVDVVVRQHQRRRTDFRVGQRLGKEDPVVLWQRPQRPSWMDQETHATIPPTLAVRELKVRVAIRGFRVQQLAVVTTLTDAERYPKSEVTGLFRLRWHAELDLRNIKISLQMDDLRGQTPEMVRREIWVHWLAYNLIRKVIAQAALTHEKSPRQLSFAAALAAVATSWDHATLAHPNGLTALAEAQLGVIAWHQVGHRPDRVEPRAIKRHPKLHRWLRQPRAQARAALCGGPPAK